MIKNTNNSQAFLPTSVKEIERLGWDSTDVIIFTGDAYIDHPSFGSAIIGRVLESLGLKVAIIPQPNWRDDLRDFKKLGKPKYFFAVTAGNMDSLINHYTPQKRLRSDDAYTAGGKSGMRPDYPTIVYSKILKKLFPETPVIIGGIEASLRRFTHYDYWQDALKPSILHESGADLLVYGMAEKPLEAIAKNFINGVEFSQLYSIMQTAYLYSNTDKKIPAEKYIELPSHQNCIKDKLAFSKAFVLTETEFNKIQPSVIIQKIYDKTLIVNPPFEPLSENEMDVIYDLPFSRLPHPRYKEKIPAFEMIKDSVTIHRGCFGGCSFCTLAAHQSKFISSRSEESVVNELKQISSAKDFKGHITDLGGPSANMYKMQAINKDLCRNCKRPSCAYPSICKNIDNSHLPLISLYKKTASLNGIKKITIGSGIRYDLFITRDDEEADKKGFYKYLELLIKEHVSGRLKVAPEHTDEKVLKLMRKPSFSQFIIFKKEFDKINFRNKLNLQLIPYFISGHPGSGYTEMAELAATVKELNLITEQAQDFTPTPMTLSSVIYYTGTNPYTNEKVYTSKSLSEKNTQKKFLLYYKKENKEVIKNLLSRIKRKDLIYKIYGKE